ncbi:MAG: NADP-dependent oxidoreductase [Bacteroidota bacterium]
MKAIIRTKAGKNLSTMLVQDLPEPQPLPKQIKVKVVSSRINPVDIDLMKGMPFLKYKDPQIGGIDGAGEVLEVGTEVTQFKTGDQVFFYRKFTDIGTWAEEIVLDAKDAAKVPPNLSIQEAGAIALPLLTAYEALQALNPERGQSVLIHGAGGGVGFQAVQLVQMMGLHVIANAGPKDQNALKAVGIQQFINYKDQAFDHVLETGSVDYIFDVLGGETLLRSITLQPKKVVSTAYPNTADLHKTGIKMPAFVRWIMNLATRKYPNAARRHQVQLIGQVTGANGTLLQEAADLIEGSTYTVRPFRTLSLAKASAKGLANTPVGTILQF